MEGVCGVYHPTDWSDPPSPVLERLKRRAPDSLTPAQQSLSQFERLRERTKSGSIEGCDSGSLHFQMTAEWLFRPPRSERVHRPFSADPDSSYQHHTITNSTTKSQKISAFGTRRTSGGSNQRKGRTKRAQSEHASKRGANGLQKRNKIHRAAIEFKHISYK